MEKSKLRRAYSAAGRSLLDRLWEELDTIMDRLMADGSPMERVHELLESIACDMDVHDDTEQRIVNNLRDWGEERGRAQGVSYAIAIIESPYYPDVPGVKERAFQRWEERQDD